MPRHGEAGRAADRLREGRPPLTTDGVVRSLYLPPWRLDLTVRSGVDPILPLAVIVRAAGAALDAAGAPGPAGLGVILTDDLELRDLNREAMGVDAPTDVLSFPLLPPSAFPDHSGQDPAVRAEAVRPFPLPPGRRIHLGDVVISVERAIEQATAGSGGQTGDVRWSPTDELRLLVTHGTLHVCGWDHVLPEEEAAMRSLERRLLGDG